MDSVQAVTIYGDIENCSSACHKILDVICKTSNDSNEGDIPLKILAQNNFMGRIIGKHGNTIKRIMEQTETKITISSIPDANSYNLERIITIEGSIKNVVDAQELISKKLRQSYEDDLCAVPPRAMTFPGLENSMATMSIGSRFPFHGGNSRGHLHGSNSRHPHPAVSPQLPSPYGMYNVAADYMPINRIGLPQNTEFQGETVSLYVPSPCVGALIGPGGSTIKEMINSSGAFIKIAPKNTKEVSDDAFERKVTIIGSPESQRIARFMIFKQFYSGGYTVPDDHRLKLEMFIPSNMIGKVIGKGGQTVRELQRRTETVIIVLEKSDSTEETPVHIIGDFYSTEAAQNEIRALINDFRSSATRHPKGAQSNNREVHSN